MEKARPKAYSYVRFSTPEQSKGDSRRRQYQAAIKYAHQHELDLVTEKQFAFFDAGVSAYRGKNVRHADSSLGRFFEYVRIGKIEPGSYLLVESLDRLSRQDVLEALPRFLDLLNAGIVVVTFDDGMVYRKGADAFQLMISIAQMYRAHNESSSKGNRVSEAWQEKQQLARKELKPLGAACPQWLSYDGSAYIVVDERALIVRRVFDMTIAGFGQRAVARQLNLEGVPVFGTLKRNASQLWGSSSVAKILTNRAVIGEYQPMKWTGGKRQPIGEPIKDYYPAIIDESMLYAALHTKSKRKVSKDTKTSDNFNVWSKLAICAACGSSMHLVNKGPEPKGGKYLRCSKGIKHGCENLSIRLAIAEGIFGEMLAKLNLSGLVKDDMGVLRKQHAEIEARLHTNREKLLSLVEMVADEPSKAGIAALSKLEKKIEDDERQLELLQQDIAQEFIFDKAGFLAKLDLKTYESRYVANQQVRRMEIKVRMRRRIDHIQFTVMKKVESGLLPRFAFRRQTGQENFVFIPLAAEFLRSSIRQGDIDSTALLPDNGRLLRLAMATAEMEPLRESVQIDDYTAFVKFDEIDEKRAANAMRKLLRGE